jgi:hypothetical protein
MDELGENVIPGARALEDGETSRLGELLISSGRLNAAELEYALTRQAQSGERLGEILLAQDLISRPGLGTALTEQQRGEVSTESGFGTGLRAAMELSHRRRRPRRVAVASGENAQGVDSVAGQCAVESNDGNGARPATDP